MVMGLGGGLGLRGLGSEVGLTLGASIIGVPVSGGVAAGSDVLLLWFQGLRV